MTHQSTAQSHAAETPAITSNKAAIKFLKVKEDEFGKALKELKISRSEIGKAWLHLRKGPAAILETAVKRIENVNSGDVSPLKLAEWSREKLAGNLGNFSGPYADKSVNKFAGVMESCFNEIRAAATASAAHLEQKVAEALSSQKSSKPAQARSPLAAVTGPSVSQVAQSPEPTPPSSAALAVTPSVVQVSVVQVSVVTVAANTPDPHIAMLQTKIADLIADPSIIRKHRESAERYFKELEDPASKAPIELRAAAFKAFQRCRIVDLGAAGYVKETSDALKNVHQMSHRDGPNTNAAWLNEAQMLTGRLEYIVRNFTADDFKASGEEIESLRRGLQITLCTVPYHKYEIGLATLMRTICKIAQVQNNTLTSIPRLAAPSPAHPEFNQTIATAKSIAEKFMADGTVDLTLENVKPALRPEVLEAMK